MARDDSEPQSQHDPPAKPLTLEIDFEKYLEFTQKFNMDEEQQRELIATLYLIMMTYVDIEFGIDSTSAACGSSCGEVEQILRSTEATSDDVVNSRTSIISGAFNDERGAA